MSVVLSIALLVTGPLRVTVAFWGDACLASLSATLVAARVFVVGANSQQQVDVEAQALCVCTLGIASSAGLALHAEVCAVFFDLRCKLST